MPRAEAEAPSTVTARSRLAPAKINLALHVVGRRADGYHLLDMLVAFADIGDRVTWRPGGDRCALEIRDTLDRAEPIPESTANLAWRALALAGRNSDTPLAGHLSVEKFLPSGAGIGGGSSDAAATLRTVLDPVRCAGADLQRGALFLGADVPVCLSGTPSRVEGIGEKITPLALPRPLPIVLIWPGAALSTPAVFCARTGTFAAPIPADAIATFFTDPLTALAGLRNDLEPAASSLLPAVGAALEAVRLAAGCRLARMSGSGSTVVGYFQKRTEADAAAERLAADHPDWWVRSTSLMNTS